MKPTTRIRLTANFLRCLALGEVGICAILLMPEPWLAAFHAWIGLGPMPDSVLLRYVIRGAGFCVGALAVALWIVASDVVRYRRLIILAGAVMLLGSPAFYLIDTTSGMPMAARIWDCTACFVAGSALLALCFWPSSNDSKSIPSIA